MVRCPNHAVMANPNMHLVTWDLRCMELWGLLMARDDYWRSVRNAWQPAFAPASLRGYQQLMDREALRLAARLAALAGAAEGLQAGSKGGGDGSGGAVVEVLSEMSRVTLAVVGTAAYGVDFSSPEYGGAALPAGASLPSTSLAASLAAARAGIEPSLVGACNDYFRTMSPAARSKWAPATALPCVLPLLRLLACALPDDILALHIQSRHVLHKVASRLISDWRARSTTTTTTTTTNGTGATANGTGATANGNGKHADGGAVAAAEAPGGGAGLASRSGVAAGSFLGLMLAARDRGSGGAVMNDTQIEAQVQTFLLAGFETTANALTFAIYLLAHNPEVAERLEAELDAHLPPPPPGAAGGGEEPEQLSMEALDKLVYTEAVLNEAMRLFPPAHATTRVAEKAMKILGYDIPAGATIWLPIAHLHTRDSVWPDPQAFRPERFLPADPASAALAARHPHAHLPFGSGSRMCIGWRFAMQEAKTVLARLCQVVRFELTPGQVPLEVVAGLTLAPKHGVTVRLTRRQQRAAKA